MLRFQALLPALFVSLLALQPHHPAAAFTMTPVIEQFEPSGRNATRSFQIVNDGSERIAVSIHLATRAMDVDGNETSKDTDDFAIYPSDFFVAAGRVQVVRVQWLGNPAPDHELTYRLIAEQVPVTPVQQRPSGGAIQMMVRYVGSVYVVPPRAQPNIQLESVAPAGGRAAGAAPMLELVFANTGSAHGLLEDPRVTLNIGGRSVTLEGKALDDLVGENILAQSKRRFLVPWPAGLALGPVTGSASIGVVP